MSSLSTVNFFTAGVHLAALRLHVLSHFSQGSLCCKLGTSSRPLHPRHTSTHTKALVSCRDVPRGFIPDPNLPTHHNAQWPKWAQQPPSQKQWQPRQQNKAQQCFGSGASRWPEFCTVFSGFNPNLSFIKSFSISCPLDVRPARPWSSSLSLVILRHGFKCHSGLCSNVTSSKTFLDNPI